MTTHRSLANDANEHPSPSIPTQTSPATVPPITGILAPAVSCTVTGHHMTTHRAQGTGLRFPVASQATKNASSSNVYSPVNAASSTASSPVNAAPSSTECTQHPNEADDDFPPIRENQDVPTGLQPGAFKIFYLNQQLLPANKKMAYILLMKSDIFNQDRLREYSLALVEEGEERTKPTVIEPEVFVDDNEPWKSLSQRKGYKTKLIATKDMMRGEYIRRLPAGKASAKNTTVMKYMELLRDHPVVDTSDLVFIEEEFQTFLQSISDQFTFEAENPVDGNLRLTKFDRLRFLVLFVGNEEIMAAYLRSTDGKDRLDVEYAGTDEAPVDWRELICELFNDETVEAATRSHATLHEDFKDPIDCPKGGYTLTLDACNKILTDQKGKLRDIIHRYNLSGNGSDMAVYEGDTDEEDGPADESESTYGRFNSARAARRATRRDGREYLTLMNGDDRKEFLRSSPSDLLYWWNEFDKYNLIYFYMGKLSDEVAASCDKEPDSTSYRKRKSDGDGSTTTAKALAVQAVTVQKEMVSNVARLGSLA